MGNCKSTDEDDEGNEFKRSRMKNFDEWLHKRLQTYFEDVEKLVLDTRMVKKEKRDITMAVEELVGNIFNEVEKIDKRFQVKKSGMVRFGDFYENTEIICTDEIEMYAVLENLSGEILIQAENTTVEFFETIQVRLKDKHIPRWEDCLSESSDNLDVMSSEKLALRFYDYAYSAVENIRKKSRDILEKEYGSLALMEENGISRRGCSICLKVVWNDTVFISVLITPILKLNEIKPYVLRQECLSDMVFEAAMKVGSVLLIPEPDDEEINKFRLSFAHIERYIMTECVSDLHRRVYRILQFLVNGYKNNASSDNQVNKKEELRHLLITHDMRCGKVNAIGECTLSIINTMEQFFKDNKTPSNGLFIPSIFVEHMNVMRRSIVHKGNSIVTVNSAAISNIKQHLVNDVGRAPVYRFSDVISKFVPANQYILDADYHDVKSREF